jgi:hypothetical protein
MSDTKLTVPTVHLNGTGKAGLIKQYEEAGSALYEAISKLRATAPHGRDYYVQKDPAALQKATAEHCARLEKLASVLEEVQELAIAVLEQV